MAKNNCKRGSGVNHTTIEASDLAWLKAYVGREQDTFVINILEDNERVGGFLHNMRKPTQSPIKADFHNV